MLFLDGIRYAAEMADLAYERLECGLQAIARSDAEPSTREIAACMLDAWSVVDAVHRFVDLTRAMPGLTHGTWLRLLEQRTEDILALRDDVQHQLDRVAALTNGGQIWGYVSWAGIDDRGAYTGKWLMISPGASYIGDSWVFVGPASLPFPVRPGRIRLNAFGRRVYLARSLDAVIEATLWINDELSNGRVRAVDSPAPDRRGSDKVFEGYAEVLVSTSKADEILQDAD